MNTMVNVVAKAVAVSVLLMGLTGCMGLNSMNKAALGVECESRAECMKQLNLPGQASGEPRFTVAPYSVESQSVKSVVGLPAIGGGSISADADVIAMKAIRDVYPNATIIPGGEVSGAIFVAPTGVNVQAYGFGGLKCEMDLNVKYGGAASTINARGVTGAALTVATGMGAICPEMKDELSKAIKEFVDVNVYKKAAVKPKE